ncbi:TetR/AcrR family transcriptional regulator [Actinacidiphila acididurans]|uniref:TetR/AcrR family transcriptional regulator n=1 Tax=Actinacidiphila acididurans TaxID=2784346 RepID=A0ABS2TPB3_9ACTN|nr:TetR/AcrR family transcriptional regulator [Actinacidiphila acididurans]MBM9504080.1 TetR/AcrR family transcriptional regulator [Actinacidiphila acididurans]
MPSHVKSGRYHHGDLRRELEEAALALVAERGPRGFTMVETSRRAGVSVAAPYKHFADRDALLASLAARSFREQHRRFTAATAASEDPAERIAAFAAAYVRFAAEEAALFDVAFCADVDKSSHPELTEAGQALFDALMPITRRLAPSEEAAFDLLIRIAAAAHGLALLHRQNMFGTTPDTLAATEARSARTARDIVAGAMDRPTA